MGTAVRLAGVMGSEAPTNASVTAKIEDRVAPFVARFRGLAVKGLIGRDAIFALVFFGVVSMLTGATMALGRIIDPAWAAFAAGATAALTLGLAGVLAGRPSKRPSRRE